MTELESESVRSVAPRFELRAFLIRDWPYLSMLALALLGVAYTGISQTSIRTYWIALTPFIGLVCVVAGWHDAGSREQRVRLIWTQALHWVAVLLAMELIYIADVSRMMNADASALSVLTLLALGTFTAGIQIGAWKVCLVGTILAIGVPGIALLERSALLILLIVLVVGALVAPWFWQRAKHKSVIVVPGRPAQPSDEVPAEAAVSHPATAAPLRSPPTPADATRLVDAEPDMPPRPPTTLP
jgi:hypothetical protein